MEDIKFFSSAAFETAVEELHAKCRETDGKMGAVVG